jgi:hypothetical protein
LEGEGEREMVRGVMRGIVETRRRLFGEPYCRRFFFLFFFSFLFLLLS